WSFSGLSIFASLENTLITGMPFIFAVSAIVPWSENPVITALPSLDATLPPRYVSNQFAMRAETGGSRVPATSV
ncbi:hypothetical protein ACVSNG_13990, partial [Pseudomonas aeruginosa]